MWQALFLGVLQGFTEFLPISSSGHLALAERWFGLVVDMRSMQSFDIVLHGGSLLALLVCYASFWRSLFTQLLRGERSSWQFFLLIFLTTIPAGLMGMLFEEVIAERFRTLGWLGGGFLCTAGMLLIAERVSLCQRKVRDRVEEVGLREACSVGFAQAIALFPSVSRSGLTLVAGLFCGLSKRCAVDFSFIIAVPILLGVNVLTLFHMVTGVVSLPAAPVLWVGFLSAFTASMMTILFLRSCISRIAFRWFSLYLFALSIFLFLGGVP